MLRKAEERSLAGGPEARSCICMKSRNRQLWSRRPEAFVSRAALGYLKKKAGLRPLAHTFAVLELGVSQARDSEPRVSTSGSLVLRQAPELSWSCRLGTRNTSPDHSYVWSLGEIIPKGVNRGRIRLADMNEVTISGYQRLARFNPE